MGHKCYYEGPLNREKWVQFLCSWTKNVFDNKIITADSDSEAMFVGYIRASVYDYETRLLKKS